MRAIDLALAGNWDEAHAIVQKLEGDPRANHIHGLLHRKEGDEANARYWFRRAGVDSRDREEPDSVLSKLRDELKRQP